MPYVKGRYYKRKYGKLSARRILLNKGSKSQAKQILALKNRISKVYKRVKPETKIVEPHNLNLGNVGFGYFGTPGQIQEHYIDMPLPNVGAGDNARVGNKITLAGPKLFFNAQYGEVFNSMITGFSNIKIPLSSNSICFRIFAVQLRQAASNFPVYSDVLSIGTINNDPIRANGLMTCPFKTGVYAKYNIIYNKVFTVSASKPEINKKIKLRLKPKHSVLYWDQNQAQFPKGAIRWYIVSAGWSSNRYSPGAGQDDIKDFNSLSFSYSTKTPYTDA